MTDQLVRTPKIHLLGDACWHFKGARDADHEDILWVVKMTSLIFPWREVFTFPRLETQDTRPSVHQDTWEQISLPFSEGPSPIQPPRFIFRGGFLAYSTNPSTCRISGSRLITPGEQLGKTGMVFTMQVIMTCSRILLLTFKIVLINTDIKD